MSSSSSAPPYLVKEAIRLVQLCVPGYASLPSDPSNYSVDALTLGTTNQLLRLKRANTFSSVSEKGPGSDDLVDDDDVKGASTGCDSEGVLTSSSSHPAVVIRFYGKGTDRLISRDGEVAIQSLFLRTFSRYPNALLYEFLEGMREADCLEFVQDTFVGHMTRLAAGFHSGAVWQSMQPPSQAHKHRVILVGGGSDTTATSTNPMQLQARIACPTPLPSTGPNAATFVDSSLTNWINVLVNLGDDGIVGTLKKEKDVKVFKSMGMTVDVLQKEVSFIRSVIANNSDSIPLALCHNDLNCFNVLINKRHPFHVHDDGAGTTTTTTSIGNITNKSQPSTPPSSSSPLTDAELFSDFRLIDFEYSGWGHVYFDLGNHFNEFAGVDVESDFNLTFPTDDFIEGWLRKYFAALQMNIESVMAASAVESCTGHGCEKEDIKVNGELLPPLTWLSLPCSSTIPKSDGNYKKAVQLTKFFSIVSHFLWSVWSVVQASESEVDFGFIPYGSMRWQRYLDKKEEFTKGLI